MRDLRVASAPGWRTRPSGRSRRLVLFNRCIGAGGSAGDLMDRARARLARGARRACSRLRPVSPQSDWYEPPKRPKPRPYEPIKTSVRAWGASRQGAGRPAHIAGGKRDHSSGRRQRRKYDSWVMTLRRGLFPARLRENGYSRPITRSSRCTISTRPATPRMSKMSSDDLPRIFSASSAS